MKEYKVTVDSDGVERWYNKEGKLHREGNKPAVIWPNGDYMLYYFNGELHREDGPAVDGLKIGNTEEWWVNGKHHREDGPAVTWASGTKQWWFNGQLHRETGPAVINSDGSEEYWLNSKKVTKNDLPILKIKEVTEKINKILKEKTVNGLSIEFDIDEVSHILSTF